MIKIWKSFFNIATEFVFDYVDNKVGRKEDSEVLYYVKIL